VKWSRRLRLWFVVTELVTGIAGCGGDSARSASNPPTQALSAEQALRAAQKSECEALCPRLSECAVEDARANMSAAELAKLDLEAKARQHTNECITQCSGSSLSPRQVRVMRRCRKESAAVCSQYLACLDAAKRNPDP
jgi:hypothetical protein